MLENVRFNAEENLTLKPEEAKKTHLVKRLSSMADLFVNDAFGTAHRSQPTVVGLPLVLRSAGGLLMEKEVFTSLESLFRSTPPGLHGAWRVRRWTIPSMLHGTCWKTVLQTRSLLLALSPMYS